MRILFIITFLADIVFAFGSLPWLPNQVAVHFDLNGTPNGFMSPVVVAVFMSITFGFIMATMLGLSGLMAIPALDRLNFFGTPNRDYWLTEENRPKAVRRCRLCLDVMGLETLIWVLLLQWTMFNANRMVLPTLNMVELWSSACILFVFIVIEIVRYYLWIRLPKSGEQ